MFLAETSIQLVPDGTLLVHLVVVVVMVVILNRTLLKPIMRILSDREAQIKGSMSEAEVLEAHRSEKLQQYESTLRDARTEGYHLLERERAEAIKIKDEKIKAFKQDISRKIAVELESLHRQEEQVKSELEIQAAVISEEIAARVLHSN